MQFVRQDLPKAFFRNASWQCTVRYQVGRAGMFQHPPHHLPPDTQAPSKRVLARQSPRPRTAEILAACIPSSRRPKRQSSRGLLASCLYGTRLALAHSRRGPRATWASRGLRQAQHLFSGLASIATNRTARAEALVAGQQTGEKESGGSCRTAGSIASGCTSAVPALEKMAWSLAVSYIATQSAAS